MPKETKKFINPLLRPSQQLETIQEDVLTDAAQAQREGAFEETSSISANKDMGAKRSKSTKDTVETLASEANGNTVSQNQKNITASQVSLSSGPTDASDHFAQALLTEETRPNTLKRRRQAPTFESTHERITVWIDKELKAQFEELAYQQSLSKTALLNEAIADLLSKFGKG